MNWWHFAKGFVRFAGKLVLVVLVVFALALRAVSRATSVMGVCAPRL